MAHQYFLRYRWQSVALCSLLGGLLGGWGIDAAIAQSESISFESPMQVSVNSPTDGPVQADAVLTLREAIEILNGTLPLTALSTAEQQRVIPSADRSVIRFDLPVGEEAIALQSILPAIARPNTTIDGTTQAGYDASRFAASEIEIPTPVVTIRPAAGQEIFRGLTLSADDITVRGLNLYGFNAASQIAQSTPPADIFITHRPAPMNRETPLPAVGYDTAKNGPPTGIVINKTGWVSPWQRRCLQKPLALAFLYLTVREQQFEKITLPITTVAPLSQAGRPTISRF